MVQEKAMALLLGLMAGVILLRRAGKGLNLILGLVGRLVVGAAFLYGVQAIAGGRFHLGVNPVTAALVGLLGLPGAAVATLAGLAQ